MNLRRINELVNNYAELADVLAEDDVAHKKNVLIEAKNDYKHAKMEVFVITVIVLILCLGGMFVRFRVFGGQGYEG